MILNAYAVLDAATALLRLLLGLAVTFLALSLWRRWRTGLSAERQGWLEDRSYFLFLLANLLLILSAVSWPLLYLLLQSYVPEWPGAMCIYGVTQVGARSIGPSRFLPGLLTALQILKPALVFLAGAWFVLYLLNRRTTSSALMPRVLLAVIPFGLLTVADAGVEGAYLIIPKKEEFLSSGCCTAVFDAEDHVSGFFSESFNERAGPWLGEAYYVINGGMALALLGYILLPAWRRSGVRLLPLAFGSLVIWPLNGMFLIVVCAPALLHLAHHHCPYDLLPAVPESVVAGALFVLGSFCIGWAWVAAWCGRSAETAPFLGHEIGKLLRLALWGYAGSMVMLSLELALA
jgi:hypothetical protein